MARSNVGGTRGFLRGRVASDLYQVTVNSKGRRVQLVRSCEESRQYSNTVEQALARMKMACLMRALSQLKQIVDHSWEGVTYGQISIGKFVEVNMPYVNWDVYCNWSAAPCFMMPLRNDDSYLLGAYQISQGSLPSPDFIRLDNLTAVGGVASFIISGLPTSACMSDLKKKFGLNSGDYITLLVQSGAYSRAGGIANACLHFLRLFINPDISDNDQLSPTNISNFFTYEGNSSFLVSYNIDDSSISIRINLRDHFPSNEGKSYAIIASRWDGVLWRRNTARFQGSFGPWQEDVGAGYPYLVFPSWFPDYNPDEGWNGYSWEEYPAPAPRSWRAVPDALTGVDL